MGVVITPYILHIVSRGIIMAAVSKFMSEALPSALPSRSCTFCGKAYSHSRSLSRHVKDVHEKENDATIACTENCTSK